MGNAIKHIKKNEYIKKGVHNVTRWPHAICILSARL